MLPITRPLWRNCAPSVPHIQNQDQWVRGLLFRASVHSLAFPYSPAPLMRTANGGWIPAAQDPTDPKTWRTPVVFT